MLIQTSRGPMDESLLSRTTGFEERPKEFVIWVEWRVPRAAPLDPLPDGASVDEQFVWAKTTQGELVKRDCHVLLKDPSVVANSIAANIG